MDVIIFHPFFKLLNNVENNNFLENETFFWGGGVALLIGWCLKSYR